MNREKDVSFSSHDNLHDSRNVLQIQLAHSFHHFLLSTSLLTSGIFSITTSLWIFFSCGSDSWGFNNFFGLGDLLGSDFFDYRSLCDNWCLCSYRSLNFSHG